MDDKVKELVEQVERNVRTILWRHFKKELTPETAYDIEKEILSCHPGLAVILHKNCSCIRDCGCVIPLAEALKGEVNDG